jgi:hypothetical protein
MGAIDCRPKGWPKSKDGSKWIGTGRPVLNPITSACHGNYQAEIGHLMYSLLKRGEVIIGCPISTADGVRAADLAWASKDCMKEFWRWWSSLCLW